MGVSRRALGPLVLVAMWLGGCGGSPGSPSSTPATTAAPSAPAPTETPEPTAEPSLEPPPAAVLIVGERRLTGEVGSYAWPGGSESAPWLPATALERFEVPGGVRVRFEVPGGPGLASWTATSAAADDPAATTRVPIGEGLGPPSFETPPDGRWVVSVHVVFADGQGDANWFWSLAVD